MQIVLTLQIGPTAQEWSMESDDIPAAVAALCEKAKAAHTRQIPATHEAEEGEA